MNIQHSEPSHASRQRICKKFTCESLILTGAASSPLHAIFSIYYEPFALTLCFGDLLDFYIFGKAERLTANRLYYKRNITLFDNR